MTRPIPTPTNEDVEQKVPTALVQEIKVEPPAGCPKEWIRSVADCPYPTESSICLEFCLKGERTVI